jgi:hypothetical protein
VSFRGAQFKSRADFDTAFFHNYAGFEAAIFEEIVSFNHAQLKGEVIFYKSDFPANVFFTNINDNDAEEEDSEDNDAEEKISEGNNAEEKKGELIFTSVNFRERAYFNGSKLKGIWFSSRPQHGETGRPIRIRVGQDPNTPTTFEKYATFRGLTCFSAHFTEVEFHDFADFSKAGFAHYVSFADTTFEKDVNFYGTTFPATQTPLQLDKMDADPNTLKDGLILDDVRFQRPANFEWQQVQGKVNTETRETWRLLEDSFKRASDLEGQNEAMYQRKQSERANGNFWEQAGNKFSFYFWGYGVRPLRLGIWLLAFYCFFTIIYLMRPQSLVGNKIKWAKFWKRVIFAIKFSAQTSWKFSYGVKRARTLRFKVLTLIHSVGFKILLIFLLKAISNTSPLLNELVGKLVQV